MFFYIRLDSESHYVRIDIYVLNLLKRIFCIHHSLSEVDLHLSLCAHANVHLTIGHSVVHFLHHVYLVFLHPLRELYHLEKGVLHVVFDVEVRSGSNMLPILLGLCLCGFGIF